MTKNATTAKICPYWSAKDNRCTVSGAGLFIPLEKHIVKYCTSEKHKSCSQYKIEQLSSKRKSRSRINRRKFPRIPARHQIILANRNGSDEIRIEAQNIADIVDLSAGGMKIAISKPLKNDTLINFTLDSSPSQGSHFGVAKVKWCRYEKAEMLFRAGLIFHNASTTHEVSSRFDLPL